MKYFFSQDSDCHWYMIPADKRAKWDEFTLNDIDDDYEKQEEFEKEFGEYRTGGGIDDIEFILP